MLSQLILPSDFVTLHVSKIGNINLCWWVYAQSGLAFRAEGERWYGARRSGALHNAGGDREVWGGGGEDCGDYNINSQFGAIERLPAFSAIMALSPEGLQKLLSIQRPGLPQSNRGQAYLSYPQFPAMESLDSDLSLLEVFSWS